MADSRTKLTIDVRAIARDAVGKALESEVRKAAQEVSQSGSPTSNKAAREVERQQRAQQRQADRVARAKARAEVTESYRRSRLQVLKDQETARQKEQAEQQAAKEKLRLEREEKKNETKRLRKLAAEEKAVADEIIRQQKDHDRVRASIARSLAAGEKKREAAMRKAEREEAKRLKNEELEAKRKEKAAATAEEKTARLEARKIATAEREAKRDAARAERLEAKKVAAAEREAKKAAAQVAREAARLEAKKTAVAERVQDSIATAEGRTPPSQAKVARELGLLGRLQQARRLQSLFPGFARIAKATGLGETALGRGLLRGGMMLGTFGGGVASGSAAVGGAAGSLSGAQGAGLLGLGGGGSMLLGGVAAGAGAVLAAYVGFLKTGIDRATSNVVRAMAVDKQLQLRVDPVAKRSARVLRQAADMQMQYAAANLGLTPEEARGIQASVRLSGGWDGIGRQRVAHQALKLAATGLSPGAATIDALAYAQGAGGGLGTDLDLTYAGRGGGIERLIRAGFQDQEIPAFLSSVAGAAGRAAGVGAFLSPAGMLGTAASLSPAIGVTQASRMTFGLQDAMQRVATGGIGAASNPAMGMLLLRTMGGFKAGGSFADMLAAQQKLSAGPTAAGLDALRTAFRSTGLNESSQTALAMARMGDLGIAMTPDLAKSWIKGQAQSADILRTVVPGAQAAASADAFATAGPMSYARTVTATSALQAAATSGQDLMAGAGALPGAQTLDQQLARAAQGLAGLSSVLDDFKAKLTEIVNVPTNWVAQ